LTKQRNEVAFNFIAAVFKRGWDHFKIDTNNKTFRELIKDEFTTKIPSSNKGKKTNSLSPIKLANFSKLPLPQLSSRPSEKVLAKSKFHGKNTSDMNKKSTKSGKILYTQILSKNIGNILKTKENFPKLLNKKSKKSTRLSSAKKTNPNLGSI